MTRPDASRRSFLRWASGTVAGAAVPAGALAAHASPTPAESPELLALGRRIEETERDFITAQRFLDEARVIFEARQPPIPPEMMEGGTDRLWRVISDEPRDMEDLRIPYRGGRPVRVVPSWSVRRSLEGIDGRLRIARDLRRRLSIIEAYEAAREALRHELGVVSAIQDRYDAARDLGDITIAVFQIPAVTMVGLAIKGHSLLAHARTEPAGPSWSVGKYGTALAAEAMQLTGGTLR